MSLKFSQKRISSEVSASTSRAMYQLICGLTLNSGLRMDMTPNNLLAAASLPWNHLTSNNDPPSRTPQYINRASPPNRTSHHSRNNVSSINDQGCPPSNSFNPSCPSYLHVKLPSYGRGRYRRNSTWRTGFRVCTPGCVYHMRRWIADSRGVGMRSPSVRRLMRIIRSRCVRRRSCWSLRRNLPSSTNTLRSSKNTCEISPSYTRIHWSLGRRTCANGLAL